MKFAIEIDTDVDSADVVGECLRGKFWKQPYRKSRYGNYRALGCYESFDYNDDVIELPDVVEKYMERWDDIEEEHETVWHHAKWQPYANCPVLCRWYWDGDGTIEFTLPDGSMLRNADCKKTYGWEWDFNLEQEDE